MLILHGFFFNLLLVQMYLQAFKTVHKKYICFGMFNVFLFLLMYGITINVFERLYYIRIRKLKKYIAVII